MPYIMLSLGQDHKKVFSEVVCQFLSNCSEFFSPNFTQLLHVYSLVKSAKKHVIIFSYAKFLDFSRNHIVISHVYKQRNVCRMNGAPCLRRVQTHYYSNNITNNLAVTLRTWHVHHRLSHMHLFS